jgi:ABC-type sugar transport system permease subunit
MKSATAVAICVIFVALMTLALFHLTTEYLEILKQDPLSLKTVGATVVYVILFITIVIGVLLLIALVLALASD